MKKGPGLSLIILAFCTFLASLGWALMQPGGIPAAVNAVRNVRQKERHVQALREQVARKSRRVERLRTDPEERKRAVREHMNKALPGETTIILPEASSPTDSAADAR